MWYEMILFIIIINTVLGVFYIVLGVFYIVLGVFSTALGVWHLIIIEYT